MYSETTNNCEKLYLKVNNMFCNSHMNVYRFIETLNEVRKDIYIQLTLIRGTNVLNK